MVKYFWHEHHPVSLSRDEFFGCQECDATNAKWNGISLAFQGQRQRKLTIPATRTILSSFSSKGHLITLTGTAASDK
ncbi:unnamed protein product [Arabidopsis halleri]